MIKFPAIAILFLAAGGPVDGRTWTNSHGRTFEADFVRLDGANAIFVMPNGRAFSSPIADLSVADQALLRGGGAARPGAPMAAAAAVAAVPAPAGNFGRPWPRDVRMDISAACKVVSEDRKSGRYIYESPSYRFTCDARITDDALRNFATMFESTRQYARALPLSMGSGRERNGKMDILLFRSMAGYVRAGGPPGSGGCFSRGVVMVPMESLGLKEGGTGFSLDIRRKNDVLIHELAHQLTPDAYMMPGARGWFSEGLAEYMAVTPYTWGYFRPDIHGNEVVSYVTTHGGGGLGGRALGTTLRAPKLKQFFLMAYSDFAGGNGNLNYGLGLLITHYFFHMEGGGTASRMTAFLKGLQAGQQGETALVPLLGGGSYEKLEGEISAAWAKKGVRIHFGAE